MSRLSSRDKREFYTGLARLMRSGTSLPAALDLLARDTPRRLRTFICGLNQHLKDGESLGDAMLHQRPKISGLEASVIAASAQAGRLDRGCDQLARYFDALERARSGIVAGMAYPLVMLHLTILVMNITELVSKGTTPYLIDTFIDFACAYGIGAAIWVLWKALEESATRSVIADRLIGIIPGLGPTRRKFALARFFATLDAQLEAQVNIWDAFANSAKTSDSALLIAAARKAMPALQGGESLSEVLASGKIIPDEFARSFRVAEKAGELDAELTQMAQRSEDLAVAALQRWSEWLPRLVYGFALLYGGWQIVSYYSATMSGIQNSDLFNY